MWKADPDRGQFDAVLEPRLDEVFLRSAEAVLDDLERIAIDTGTGIFLADPAGIIAGFRGETQVPAPRSGSFPPSVPP